MGLGAESEFGAGILHVFGRQLKLFRVRVGMERAEFGALTGYSASTIASFEQGRRISSPKFIDRADEVLDAGGVLKAGKEEVARAQYPAFFRDAARLEAEAVELRAYDTHIVNGLLQSEEYTRALLGMRRPLLNEDTIEQRVAARLIRQEVFNKWPAPLLSFVMEESVVKRGLGGRAAKHGQLEQILLIGQKRNVEIQIMPLDREDNAGVDGAFTVLTRQGGNQFGYTEAQGKGTLVTDREEVRALSARYGIIRAQALTPSESLAYIEKLLGEL
ncbi:helix-turn-helix domain-containing protein [Streptomyces sp. NBC_01381]|uniref:helix-turn-helix domain-containing protein n=1 Tax=Streptomyces sp. NBC_01381 TaxID=2903845 RepID=UPI00224CD8B8|nr:helix-turn-helix transcriptional regulator [Streptomyces sp. NBC_01381]MCX4667971.1 helix-turn-helix domain-containing protein [Streptomyces sp. NBC_01381]